MTTAPSWLDDSGAFRERLAVQWIWCPPARGEGPQRYGLKLGGGLTVPLGQEVTREELEQEGVLRTEVAAIEALQRYGSPAAWEEQAQTVREARKTVFPLPDTVARALSVAPVEDALETFISILTHYVQRLHAAERVLDDDGWRFNHKTGRAERVGAGNRPQTFRRRLVVMLAQSLRPEQPLQNNKALREEIARVVRWWLPPEDADPAKDGPIDAALKNERTRQSGLRRK